MKLRRLLSVLLAVAVVASCVLAGGTIAASGADSDIAASGSAYEDMLSKTTAENGYGLADTVNEGTILQAWSWSFKNIEDNLETIAEQGFTTVQVSPPNEIKKGTSGAKFLQSDNQNGWWMFYQPAGFQLNNSTDNALGTKAEFTSMCNKAHELGVKIIVDAVINHMGTKEGDDSNTSSDPMSHVTPKAQTFEPEIYNNKLFHSPWAKMTYKEDPNQFSQYDSTYDLTRNCTSGLPDLKTEDSRVQTAIYDYMDELITAGADGFRFDAAKHIETPDDISGLKSDFWTNTLVKVKNAHPESEVYAYGEILNTCGVNRPFSMYTKLFDVTDSSSYWGIKDAATSGGGNATPYYPSTNFTADNTVLWDESHDTYVDGSTTNLTTAQRGKIWALVAGRAGISTVYLARPDDSTNTNALYNISLGEARKTSWSNATTKAINQFHNYFLGQSEYCTANSAGTAYIERGSTGAMIVTLGGTYGKDVTLSNHRLTAGTYTDAITGNTFTVTKSQIKGKVGSTGVACIYENTYVAPTEPPVTYILGDVNDDGAADIIDVTMILRYCVDLVEFSDKQLLAGDVDGDGLVTVIDATFVQRYDAQVPVKYDIGQEKSTYNKPDPTTPTPKPTTPTPTPTTPQPTSEPTEAPEPVGSFLLTDNFGWGVAYVYAWDADGNEIYGEWPGAAQAETVVNDYGETQFRCYVPEGAVGVILNNGAGAQTEDITDFTYDGYWMDGSQNEKGHYLVTGWYLEPGPDPTDAPTPDPTDEPTPDPTDAPDPSDDGYYLVGSFNGWTASPEYKLSENSANPGEYMISTTLSEGDSLKVVNHADGAETWYPDGMDNDYVVDAAHAGEVTIYFKATYQADWAAFGGYFYIDGGSTPTPDPTDEPTPDPTDAPDPSDDGYYLVGSFNGWTASPEYQLSENSANPGEYMISTTLSEGDSLKVVNHADGAETWYPDGTDNDYVVDAAHAGEVTIYFKATYQADWAAFGGYFYIDGGSTPSPDPTDEPTPDPTDAPDPSDDGYYLVGSFNGWTASPEYQLSENSANPGEYMISTTLSEGDSLKVVNHADGTETWYPDGMDNDYVVDAAHAGEVTIYFKATYQADWAAFGGYFYIDGGSAPTPDPTDEPTPDPTDAPDPSDDGYYLVGSFNGWTASSEYKLTENSANPGEYMISTTLSEGDSLKVVNHANGAETWYPDGMDNDYVVDAAHAGEVTIYFKATYQADWAAFGGYFYIDGGSTPTPDPTDEPTPDPSGDDITFEPGDASVANPAWFAWVWGNGESGKWIAGSADGSGNITFAGAAAYTDMLVVRMPTGSTSADWSSCWNQSEDISIQQGKTLYFTGWGSGNKFLIGWK